MNYNAQSPTNTWVNNFKNTLDQPIFNSNSQHILLKKLYKNIDDADKMITKCLSFDQVLQNLNVSLTTSDINKSKYITVSDITKSKYINDPNDYNTIDVFKRIKRYKYTYIEQAFLNNKKPTTIVTNNDLLTALHTKYRVVILDAMDDYINNFCPSLNTKPQDGIDIENLLYNTIKYQDFKMYQTVTQCLIFINEDGSYFLALPVLMNIIRCEENYDNKKLIKSLAANAKLPIIKTNLKTISKILKPIPILKIDNFVPFQLVYQPILNNDNGIITQNDYFNYNIKQNYNYYLIHNKLHFKFSMYFKSTELTKIIKSIKKYHYTNLKNIKNTTNVNQLIDINNILDNLISMYNTAINQYISNHTDIKFINDGLITYNYQFHNQYWQNILNQMPRPHKNSDNDNSDFMNTLKYGKNNNCLADLYDILSNIGMHLLITKQTTTNKVKTTVKSIPISQKNQRNKRVPLIKPQGVNKILLTLNYNDQHLFYYCNQHLISLYGNNKCDLIHDAKLS